MTGGTGFLGRWLVRRLLALDAVVFALVREGGHGLPVEWARPRLIPVTGSLSALPRIREVLCDHKIDTVIHLAAQSLVHAAKADPVATLETNVAGTWNVLEAARQAGVRQTLVASSEKAYGEGGPLPWNELQPLQGRYPYDCSKSCADLIAQMYLTTYGLPVSIIRTPNLFGGGDLNFSRTFPGAIRATLEGKTFVIRGNGRAIRDFLYVRDAAEAWLFLAAKLAGGTQQGAWNFSLEVRWTVLDCVNAVLESMGRTDLKPVILNQPGAEIAEQYSDCTKARELLGWRPEFDMPAALAETIRWYRDRMDRERAGAKAAPATSAADMEYGVTVR